MDIQFKNDQTTNNKSEYKICQICRKTNASYSCPRCNIPYCSLDCYRDQSNHLKCSEDFYQDQVITELKMCKLEENSDKQKMVEILKKVANDYEKDKILPEYSDASENEESTELEENLLINAYETEITRWTPWWRKYKEHMLNETDAHDEKTYEFNKNLIRRSLKIAVGNASSFIVNDIFGLFYTYAMLSYVYQIEEAQPDFELDVNNNLDDEIVMNLLKIDQVLREKCVRKTSLGSTLALYIRVLLEEQDLFIKKYLSDAFLTSINI